MRSPCARKTRCSAGHRPEARRPGFTSLFAVFVFFIFSALGLSLILLTQVYQRSLGYRRLAGSLVYAAENGVKLGLAEVLGRLESLPAYRPLAPELLDIYKEDVAGAGGLVLTDALGLRFPHVALEEWRDFVWQTSVAGALVSSADEGAWIQARYRLEFAGEGRIAGVRALRGSNLAAETVIAAGRIPLAWFPFLTGPGTPDEEKDKVSFLREPQNLVAAATLAAETNPVPADATPLLEKALKIKLLRPEDLTRAGLRRALGLEPVDEPVPEGVYLIRDDLGLGGGFVQGDLDELIPAIDGDEQVIAFRSRAGEWQLRFDPAIGRTTFTTPAGRESFDLVPRGILVVNGRISSLGGGVVDAAGRVEMVKDEAVPSVRRGVSLTIVCTDRVTISSHLVLQGVRWQDGVPYLDDSPTQLLIYAAGRDPIQGTPRDGAIIIDADAPPDLRLEASLAASGEFKVKGEGKTVEVAGGVQAGRVLL
ncbi:MAG: hypothetical protein OEW05_14105, partial [Candidatus Aminicenantes bacterium]|nr:hypothetical protein [Candidatus Aminicenantes bacterium]